MTANDERMMLAAIYTAKSKMSPTLITFPDGVEIVCTPRMREPGLRGSNPTLAYVDEITDLADVADEVIVAEARKRKFFVIGQGK